MKSNQPIRHKSPRDSLSLALKLGLGALLIFYVLRSRMIDFSTLGGMLFSPSNLLIGFGFLSFITLCSTCRWFLLSRAQGLSLDFFSMFQLTMIGVFFNTFMPGSVGGDVIKAWYVAGREPDRKTKAVFTVFIDRAIGLSVFFFYAAVTLVFYHGWLAHHPQMKYLAYGIWAFTITSALLMSLFFVSVSFKLPGSAWIKARLRQAGVLYRVFEATILYRHHSKTLAAALALSAVSIFGNTLLFKLLGDTLGIPLTLPQYFIVVPIGLTVSAAPILPGGIGVGQVAFFTLFKWVGLENPQQGATLYTLIQVYTILFNCMGAFFYVRFRRKC